MISNNFSDLKFLNTFREIIKANSLKNASFTNFFFHFYTSSGEKWLIIIFNPLCSTNFSNFRLSSELNPCMIFFWVAVLKMVKRTNYQHSKSRSSAKTSQRFEEKKKSGNFNAKESLKFCIDGKVRLEKLYAPKIT